MHFSQPQIEVQKYLHIDCCNTTYCEYYHLYVSVSLCTPKWNVQSQMNVNTYADLETAEATMQSKIKILESNIK